MQGPRDPHLPHAIKPQPDFWEEVYQGGRGNYFLSNPPDGRIEGSLEKFPKGYKGAFNSIIREIRQFDAKRNK